MTSPPERDTPPLLALSAVGFGIGLTAGAAIRSWAALVTVLALLASASALLWAPPRRRRRRLDRMHAAVAARNPLGWR